MKKSSNAFWKSCPEKKYKVKNLKAEEILKPKTILTL
tara:strand:+ start:231 stop:341 length:111 start_codon:yes stop_codon:yes gene_type:complete